MRVIDFRSDTVTKPSPEMREEMMKAEVGDDVYGDDPTINMLEDYAAEKTGFGAAMFTASGTSANLLAIMSHCQRGDEYIVGQTAHTYRYEGGGAAVLGSIQPQPIEFNSDSTIDLAIVEEKIKPDDIHFARTKLFCLENTQNGKILPMDYLKEASKFANKKNLQFHLDGARVLNASRELDIDIKEITSLFDSVSICLSKGLGAPIGSILCASPELIKNARRWRKVTGGGMRQAGFLAAAGLYALENNYDRLKEDHLNAKRLTTKLKEINGCEIQGEAQTNMAFIRFSDDFNGLEGYLKEKGILISQGKITRFVTHLDISSEDLDTLAEAIKGFVSR
ncbi:MAG: low-specificity L-threonine aldolase [Desulfotalea sp.]